MRAFLIFGWFSLSMYCWLLTVPKKDMAAKIVTKMVEKKDSLR
jgi:hypothetical protein